MSIISGQSNISSILKNPAHTRNSLLVQTANRVRFQLPNSSDIKTVLEGVLKGDNVKQYEEILCVLRDSDLKDENLFSFIEASRECISLLGRDARSYVEGILKVNWPLQSNHIVNTYQTFLLELLTAHNYHVPLALEKLVRFFYFDGCWLNGKPTEVGWKVFSSIHHVLEKIFTIIPISCNIFMQAVATSYPYYKKSCEENESYLFNLLSVLKYKPRLRSEILVLVINRLIILDVHAPKSDIEECDTVEDGDETQYDMDTADSDNFQMKHPIANTLDCCMLQLFEFIKNECYENDELNYKKSEKLYKDIIQIFEDIILPTHAVHHVQFIMFYICSFKLVFAEAFLNFLWKKVSNPNVAIVQRQVSICYIASLLARAKFIPISMIRAMLFEMSAWLQFYVKRQDSIVDTHGSSRKGGASAHGVFYTVAQALFYVIAFRHKDLTNTKKNLIFLQSLNLTKLVTCPLNPLRYCLPIVAQNFAAVTRAEQLVYCYTIMERNERNNMAVMYGEQIVRAHESLDTFFPFDPYILSRSGLIVEDIYLKYESSLSTNSIDYKRSGLPMEEDDFLLDQSFNDSVSSTKKNKTPHKFSYGSSPGFKT